MLVAEKVTNDGHAGYFGLLNGLELTRKRPSEGRQRVRCARASGAADRTGLRQHVVGSPDGREFAVETRQGESMHLLGAMVVPLWPRALKRGRSVGDDDRREAEVRRHARGCRHAMIGRNAREDDGTNLPSAEVRLERRADESAVYRLLEDRFTGLRGDFWLERIARPVGPER